MWTSIICLIAGVLIGVFANRFGNKPFDCENCRYFQGDGTDKLIRDLDLVESFKRKVK